MAEESTDVQVVSVRYRNYKGVVADRTIRPVRIWFGSTEWHSDAQWLLEAFDVEKGAIRDFALRDILDFDASTVCI